MKRKKKLPVYQYKLPLRVPKEPVKPKFNGPHIVFYDGQWHIYRNKWKSQFRGPKLYAAAISAPTIPQLQHRIRKEHDGWRYGKHQLI